MDHKLCGRREPPTAMKYNIQQKVLNILELAKELSPDEFHSLSCELTKLSPCSVELLKKQMNFVRDTITKRKKSQSVRADEEDFKSRTSSGVCGRQCTDDPGAPVPRNADPETSPATKVTVIIRGDVIAKYDKFYVDTEKVTEAKTHDPLSGDLAIVDPNGTLVFWCYISRTNVCKFNTQLTGLDAAKMKMGLEIKTVHELIAKLFRGKILVGADFNNDLKSLGIIPTDISIHTEDIQNFYQDGKKRKISLAYLAEHFLGDNVQGATHSSIKDARLTALCDRKMVEFKKLGMTRFSCPVMDELREDPANNPKLKLNVQFDRCTCGIGKKKKKKPKSTSFYSLDEFDLDNYM